ALPAVFAGFALLAVVLSAIGLFGVAAHAVACRRTELALRIALGADPVRLLCATLGHGAVMVGAGLAVGVVLSLWAARGLSGMVVTARQSDALSIGLATAILVATGAAAVLPAALRAARTDPLLALRSEGWRAPRRSAWAACACRPTRIETRNAPSRCCTPRSMRASRCSTRPTPTAATSMTSGTTNG